MKTHVFSLTILSSLGGESRNFIVTVPANSSTLAAAKLEKIIANPEKSSTFFDFAVAPKSKNIQYTYLGGADRPAAFEFQGYRKIALTPIPFPTILGT